MFKFIHTEMKQMRKQCIFKQKSWIHVGLSVIFTHPPPPLTVIRTLREGNIFSRACHSVQRGKGEYHVTATYM